MVFYKPMLKINQSLICGIGHMSWYSFCNTILLQILFSHNNYFSELVDRRTKTLTNDVPKLPR